MIVTMKRREFITLLGGRGGVAARGADAAVDDAGDRMVERKIIGRSRVCPQSISARVR